MQPNAEMSYCHVAIGLVILVCGCIDEPPIQEQHLQANADGTNVITIGMSEPPMQEPVTVIRNVTFANNAIDETSCYVMIDGVCMDEEMGLIDGGA